MTDKTCTTCAYAGMDGIAMRSTERCRLCLTGLDLPNWLPIWLPTWPYEDFVEVPGLVQKIGDEARMDIIGQNGNDGLHYESVDPTGITSFCLGNGALMCDGCPQEKNWKMLNQLPDPLRLELQAKAQRIVDDACILSGRPWHGGEKKPGDFNRYWMFTQPDHHNFPCWQKVVPEAYPRVTMEIPMPNVSKEDVAAFKRYWNGMVTSVTSAPEVVPVNISHVQVDPIVESVRAKLLQRSQVGIKKYGTMLDRKDLTELDWLKHAQEEAMDLCNYLERLIQDKQRAS